MALARAAAAAIAARTVSEVAAAHRAVPVIAAKARSAAIISYPRRRGRCHVYHRGVQQPLLKSSAVVALVDPSSTKLPRHSRSLATIRRLRESQPLKVVVLVHGFILRKTGCPGEVAIMDFGSFKRNMMRL